MCLAACQTVQAAPTKALPTPRVVIVTQTPTLIPTPTPTVGKLIGPYTIEGLRQHQFESGKITVVSTLAQTDIYTCYLIRYPSDGLSITGIMQIPVEGHAPFPVIVMDHGYFNREDYSSGDGSDRAAEYLNRHGYLTLSSDYRSWGDSDIGPSLFYSGLAIDVVNLIRAIPSIPEADADRIGLWGHSMGGGVTMKVLEIDSHARAAVLYSTVSADDADVIGRWGPGCVGDIATGERRYGCNSSDILPSSLSPALIRAYQAAVRDPDLLRQISPIYHLGLVTVPIEINYGTNDGKTLAGVPPEWSKKLYQALKDAGKDAQLFAYEGEYHSFNGDAWIAFMERAAHLYDKYVKYGP